MKLAVVAVVCAACGASPSEPRKLAFERWSPPQPTSHDIFLAARGDIIVMAHRMSRDAGETWHALDPQLGAPTRVAITNEVIATYANGLVRWDLATGTITTVPGAPPYTTDRSWRADPSSGRFIVIESVENSISVETSSGWAKGSLPQPAATETRPYVTDVESNGELLLAKSAWGIHRSVDDGATWELVTNYVPGSGRDLIVLADKRFALVGGPTTYAFSAAGQPAGILGSLVLDGSGATVCEDGAIVAGNRVTRDFGKSWQSLLYAGDLPIAVVRAGCGGGRYWALVLSDSWGYRLVRYDTLGATPVVAGNWDAVGDQAWSPSGPPIVRAEDGTFLVAGLALVPDSSTWTLQEVPARTWASGPTLFGVTQQKFFASHNGGVTWTAAAALGLGATEPEAFALHGGALHVSQFTGGREGEVDAWRSLVWKSEDNGASWFVAYDARATRMDDRPIVGETHRFVGVLDDGSWIATDAVSRDAGVTWEKTDVKGDRGLAHLTRHGSLVTGDAAEEVWRVYSDGGLGELTATWSMAADGMPIPAAQMRTVAFDDEGYAYTARGTPNVQIWRSNKPVD